MRLFNIRKTEVKSTVEVQFLQNVTEYYLPLFESIVLYVKMYR